MTSIKILVESGAQNRLALWVYNITECIEFSIHRTLNYCLQLSPFYTSKAVSLDPLLYYQRAVSACLLV